MRSFRIVLEYTHKEEDILHPSQWDWYSLLDCGWGSGETVSVVNVEEIPTPEGHKEDLADV